MTEQPGENGVVSDVPTSPVVTGDGDGNPTLNLNTVSEGQTFTGLINDDVESYLVGNVNLVDDGAPVKVASTGDLTATNGDPTVTGDPTVVTGDPTVVTGDPTVVTGPAVVTETDPTVVTETDPAVVTETDPALVTETDPAVTNPAAPKVAGTDPYDYSGVVETDVPVEQPPNPNPDAGDGGTKVTIGPNQTLWGLIGEHYKGKYPLEAVYAANHLEPRVVDNNGKKELVDPIYKVGDEFILPPEDKIDELTQQYRARVNELGKTSEERVGAGAERSEVKLIFGDTLYSLAAKKYGTDDPPLAAIYEANGMTPKLVEKDGKMELVAPTYYAGKTYVLPAESEIADLNKKFWERMGHPEQAGPPAEVPAPASSESDGYDYSGDPNAPPKAPPDVSPGPAVEVDPEAPPIVPGPDPEGRMPKY